jgi:hypothetical protein
LIHQGVRRDDDHATLGLPCTSPGSTSRGVEYVFRSTDCTTTQGGFDRPEVHVDPFNDDRIYMAVNGAVPGRVVAG